MTTRTKTVLICHRHIGVTLQPTAIVPCGIFTASLIRCYDVMIHALHISHFEILCVIAVPGELLSIKLVLRVETRYGCHEKITIVFEGGRDLHKFKTVT